MDKKLLASVAMISPLAFVAQAQAALPAGWTTSSGLLQWTVVPSANQADANRWIPVNGMTAPTVNTTTGNLQGTASIGAFSNAIKPLAINDAKGSNYSFVVAGLDNAAFYFNGQAPLWEKVQATLAADGTLAEGQAVDADGLVYEQKVDSKGNPVFEQAKNEDGSLKYEQATNEDGSLKYEQKVDEDGKPVVGEDGNPVYDETKPVYDTTKPVYDTTKPVPDTTKPVWAVEDGKPVYVMTKDEEGNVTATTTDDTKALLTWANVTAATFGNKYYKFANATNGVIASLGSTYTGFEVRMIDITKPTFEVGALTLTLNYNFTTAYTAFNGYATASGNGIEALTDYSSPTDLMELPQGLNILPEVYAAGAPVPADAEAKTTALQNEFKVLDSKKTNVNAAIADVGSGDKTKLYDIYGKKNLQEFNFKLKENQAYPTGSTDLITDSLTTLKNLIVGPDGKGGFNAKKTAETNRVKNYNNNYVNYEVKKADVDALDADVTKFANWTGKAFNADGTENTKGDTYTYNGVKVTAEQITYVNAINAEKAKVVASAIANYKAALNKAYNNGGEAVPTNKVIYDTDIKNAYASGQTPYTLDEVKALVATFKNQDGTAQTLQSAVDTALKTYNDWYYFWKQVGVTDKDNAIAAQNTMGECVNALATDEDGIYSSELPSTDPMDQGYQKGTNAFSDKVAIATGEVKRIFNDNKGFAIPENTVKDLVVIPDVDVAFTASKDTATQRISDMKAVCTNLAAEVVSQNNQWKAVLSDWNTLYDEYMSTAAFVAGKTSIDGVDDDLLEELQDLQEAYLKTLTDAKKGLYAWDYSQYVAHTLDAFTSITTDSKGNVTAYSDMTAAYKAEYDKVTAAREAFKKKLGDKDTSNLALYLTVQNDLYGCWEGQNGIKSRSDALGLKTQDIFGNTYNNINNALKAIWAKKDTTPAADLKESLGSIQTQTNDFKTTAETVLGDLEKAKASIATLNAALTTLNNEITDKDKQILPGTDTSKGSDLAKAKTEAQTVYDTINVTVVNGGKNGNTTYKGFKGEYNDIINNATNPQACYQASTALNNKLDPAVADGDNSTLGQINSAALTYAKAVYSANLTNVQNYKSGLTAKYNAMVAADAPGIKNVTSVVGSDVADATPTTIKECHDANKDLKTALAGYQQDNAVLLGVVANYDANTANKAKISILDVTVGNKTATPGVAAEQNIVPVADQIKTLTVAPATDHFIDVDLKAIQQEAKALTAAAEAKYQNYATNVNDGAVAYQPVLATDINTINGEITKLLADVVANNNNWNALVSKSTAVSEAGRIAKEKIGALGNYEDYIATAQAAITAEMEKLTAWNAEIAEAFGNGELVDEASVNKYDTQFDGVNQEIAKILNDALGGANVEGSYLYELNQYNKGLLQDNDMYYDSLVDTWKTATATIYDYLYKTGDGAYHTAIVNIVTPRDKAQDWYTQLDLLRTATDSYLAALLTTPSGNKTVGQEVNSANGAVLFPNGLQIPVITTDEETGEMIPELKSFKTEKDIYAAISAAATAIADGFSDMMEGTTAEPGINPLCKAEASSRYTAETTAATALINGVGQRLANATGYDLNDAKGLAIEVNGNTPLVDLYDMAAEVYAGCCDVDKKTGKPILGTISNVPAYVVNMTQAFKDLDRINSIGSYTATDDASKAAINAYVLSQCQDIWTNAYAKAKTDIQTAANAADDEALKAEVEAYLTTIAALNTGITTGTYKDSSNKTQQIWKNLEVTTTVDGVTMAYLQKYLDPLAEDVEKATSLVYNNVKAGWNAEARVEFQPLVDDAQDAFDALAALSGYSTAAQVEALNGLNSQLEDLKSGLKASDLYNAAYFEPEEGDEIPEGDYAKVNPDYVDDAEAFMLAVEDAYAPAYEAEWTYANVDLKQAALQAFNMYATSDKNGNILDDATVEAYNKQYQAFIPRLNAAAPDEDQNYTVASVWETLRKIESDMCDYIMELQNLLPESADQYNPLEAAKAKIDASYEQAQADVDALSKLISDANTAYGADLCEKVNALQPSVDALDAQIEEAYDAFTAAYEGDDKNDVIANASGYEAIFAGISNDANGSLKTAIDQQITIAAKNFQVNKCYNAAVATVNGYVTSIENAHDLAVEYNPTDYTNDGYLELMGNPAAKPATPGLIKTLLGSLSDKQKALTANDALTADDVTAADFDLSSCSGKTVSYVKETLAKVANQEKLNVQKEAQYWIDYLESPNNKDLYIDKDALIDSFKALKTKAGNVATDPIKASNMDTTAKAEKKYGEVMKSLEDISGEIDATEENGNKYNRYELGNVDLSADGSVNYVDAMMVLRLIRDNTESAAQLYKNMVLGTEKQRAEAYAADCNQDKKIDISDFNWIINAYINGTETEAQKAPGRTAPKRHVAPTVDGNNSVSFAFVGEFDGHDRYAIMLDNESTLLAGQFDVKLPAGASIADVTTGERAESHEVMYGEQDGILRVIVYSEDNTAIAGNSGVIAYIDVDGAELSLKSATVGDNKFNSIELAVSGTTVADMIIDGVNKAKEVIFDAAGRMYNSLQRGVNIIRNADGTTTKKINK